MNLRLMQFFAALRRNSGRNQLHRLLPFDPLHILQRTKRFFQEEIKASGNPYEETDTYCIHVDREMNRAPRLSLRKPFSLSTGGDG